MNRSTVILNVAYTAIGMIDNIATRIKTAIFSIQAKVKALLKMMENKMQKVIK